MVGSIEDAGGRRDAFSRSSQCRLANLRHDRHSNAIPTFPRKLGIVGQVQTEALDLQT